MKSRLPVLLFLLLSLTLAGCDKPETKRDKYLERGNALFEAKDYDRARLEYKNAARIDPTRAEIRYRLALVDEAQGDIAKALRGFMAAEQQDAHYAPALSKLAHYLLTADEIDGARKRIDILLADAPEDPQARALSAALALREGQTVKAEAEARTALAKEPGHILGTSVLAGVFSARGQMAQAFETVEESLKLHPKDLSLLMLRVMLHAKTGDLPRMAEAYEPVFKAYPDQIQFRFDLAESWAKAGNLDQAEEVLRTALATHPGNREARRRLFLFLSDHRGFEAAEKELNGFIAAAPNEAELPFWLAELYVKNNAAEKAVTLLESFARKAAEETAALNAQSTLARLYLMQGHRETAEKLVAYVLKNDSSNADALFIRARLAYDDGDYERAVGDLRTLAQNKKVATRALLLMAETLLKQGRLDLATDALVQLLNLDPTDQKARVRLAQFYGLQGDKDRALATIKNVNKMDPAYAIGWESAARLAIESQDWAFATQATDKLETLDGQKLTALFLRAEIWARTQQAPLAEKAYRQIIETASGQPLAQHALRALATLEAGTAYLQKVAAFATPYAFANEGMATIYGQILAAAGQLDQAALAFDKALALHPVTQDAFVERAKIFIAQGDPQSAVALLQTAMQKIGADVRAPFLLADILTAQGKTDEAITLYEKLLQKNPALDLAANNLAQLVADLRAGNKDAMQSARTAAERFISSANPYYLDTLGWVYLRAGDLAQAAPVLQRALSMLKDPPAQMYYHHGLLMLKLGRVDEARESLLKATQNKAPYPGYEEALKWLATLPAPEPQKEGP